MSVYQWRAVSTAQYNERTFIVNIVVSTVTSLLASKATRVFLLWNKCVDWRGCAGHLYHSSPGDHWRSRGWSYAKRCVCWSQIWHCLVQHVWIGLVYVCVVWWEVCVVNRSEGIVPYDVACPKWRLSDSVLTAHNCVCLVIAWGRHHSIWWWL